MATACSTRPHPAVCEVVRRAGRSADPEPQEPTEAGCWSRLPLAGVMDGHQMASLSNERCNRCCVGSLACCGEPAVEGDVEGVQGYLPAHGPAGLVLAGRAQRLDRHRLAGFDSLALSGPAGRGTERWWPHVVYCEELASRGTSARSRRGEGSADGRGPPPAGSFAGRVHVVFHHRPGLHQGVRQFRVEQRRSPPPVPADIAGFPPKSACQLVDRDSVHRLCVRFGMTRQHDPSRYSPGLYIQSAAGPLFSEDLHVHRAGWDLC